MTLTTAPTVSSDTALQVYLLGTVDLEAVLRLQRRLHFEISGQRDQAILLLCEHPPVITVGRQGSRAHIFCGPEELRSRRWNVRWVNRGGGCLLHAPGQLAAYPLLPLDRLGWSVPLYLNRLHEIILRLLNDFGVEGACRPGQAGVWVGARPLAAVGVAVRDWVSYYGAWVNVCPDLELFRLIRWGDAAQPPMTSLVRERKGGLRPALVRERLLEHFRDLLGFARVSLFTEHPALNGQVQRCRATGPVKA